MISVMEFSDNWRELPLGYFTLGGMHYRSIQYESIYKYKTKIYAKNEKNHWIEVNISGKIIKTDPSDPENGGWYYPGYPYHKPIRFMDGI